MNFFRVVEEVGAALRAIPPLSGRVYPYNAAMVQPPAAIVDLPETVEYHGSYQNGMDSCVVPVTVVVGLVSDRAAHAELAPYLAGGGELSVRRAVESHPYTACDDATVPRGEVKVVTFGQVQMLGALFDVQVKGSGG